MISAYAASDVGLRRECNEDAFLCLPERGLFAVADGLGGLAYGEVASRMVVEMLAAGEDESFEDMTAFVRTISETIRRKGFELGSGMIGTTLTFAMLRSGYLRIAQVGDSVAFLTTPSGESLQLTEDQTVAEERRRSGRSDIEPYMEHVLTQCIGQDGEVVPVVFMRPFPDGAHLLLCSDGITKTVDRADILKQLAAATSPAELVDSLIRKANLMGGPDNSTAVAVFA
jgi:protein phosphatase